jgi:hypothetical protein
MGAIFEKAFIINVKNLFQLPLTNFKISATNETCSDNNDGKINITATQNLNYKVTVTINNVSTDYPFTTALEVSPLNAGPYTVCITVTGQADYKQCYDLTITEHKQQSNLFKFYNSGVAATFYAPFPVDITPPKFSQSIGAAGKVTLSWNGADVDSDITGYDIYAGTSLTNMIAVNKDLPATTFDLPVINATVYYWRVITKDSQANISTSDVYQFSVN